MIISRMLSLYDVSIEENFCEHCTNGSLRHGHLKIYKSAISLLHIRWQCGTARIHPLHDAIARCWPRSNGLTYLLPTGLTAANLQQRVCCCGPSCNRQTDGWADKTEKHCTVTQTLHTMWAVDICYIALMDRQPDWCFRPSAMDQVKVKCTIPHEKHRLISVSP